MHLLTQFQGELEHHHVKRLYCHTNRNRHVVQMTRHERRETRLLRARRAANRKRTHAHLVAFSENDPLPFTDVQMHHDMSESKRHCQDAFTFCRNFPNDPASKVGRTHNSKMAEYSQRFSALAGLRSQAEGPLTWPVTES